METLEVALTQTVAQVFDHWEALNGDATEKGAKVNGQSLVYLITPCRGLTSFADLAVKIRTRKGLKPDVPLYEYYYDKL